MKSIGVLTIGQSPRADLLGVDIQSALGPTVRVIERGALDGMSKAEISAITPSPTEYRLITLLLDGTTVQISREAILERMQSHITDLEQNENVDATLIVCTGAFPPFAHTKPLLIPQAALYSAVAGLANGNLIASIMPLPTQQAQSIKKWQEIGVDNVTLFPISPYAPDRLPAIEAAAYTAHQAGAAVLFLDGYAYDRVSFPGPIVLSRTLSARLLIELTE